MRMFDFLCPGPGRTALRVMRIVLLLAVLLTGSLPVAVEAAGLGDARREAITESLHGRWNAAVGRKTLTLVFETDGRYRVASERGDFQVEENRLLLHPDGAEAPVAYTLDLRPDQLTLSGGDLAGSVTFIRDIASATPVRDYLRGWFVTTPGEMRAKGERILAILLIVMVSVGMVSLLGRLGQFLIHSQWGPLKYLFTRYKTKTRTIQSVILNVVKYFIYFTAFGQILAELGVNYATYFASLSVIGLAVGFGCQGLVQDIVTGFFLIIDGQFGVGDMVEISGQTGIVEEVGLRTTRLRNVLGQMVVIPNRNIALVGNFRHGYLRGRVDVAVKPGQEGLAEARALKFGEGFARQYEGLVLEKPTAGGVFALPSGERFIRLHLNLWPGQQPLVDTQFLPRLRAFLVAEGVEIPGDRALVTYREPPYKYPKLWAFQRKKDDEAAEEAKAVGEATD
ncbi:MAG: mechanosensitive ion channel family protein [Puniceicoccaceae bacterium]|nr:MAG: mechanosensitive ion channel family protein [Puniceicoccaceae bacterium]